MLKTANEFIKSGFFISAILPKLKNQNLRTIKKRGQLHAFLLGDISKATPNWQ